MRRAAIIFHRFGPYHWARMVAAAKHCEIVAIEEAVQTAEYAWDELAQPKASNLKRISLLGKNERPRKIALEIALRVRKALQEAAPDTLFIPGWSDPAALAGLDWALGANVPVVIMSESTRFDEERGMVREFLKSLVVKLCSAALVGGKPHAEYIEELGMNRESVFTGYDAVDNDYFATGAVHARANATRLREEMRLPEWYFLASSRFLERKNLARLICAYADYRKRSEGSRQKSEKWQLVLLGDGPLKPDLCSLISDLGVLEHVVLPGFKQYDQLPLYYGLASAFIHASLSEPWGLVVNEAMAAGLPAIVSKQCGCATDLVKHGENGFQFDATDEQGLTQLMVRVASLSESERATMTEKGRKIVVEWSPQNFGRQFEAAGEMAHQNFCNRRSVFSSLLLNGLIRYLNARAARMLPVTQAGVAI